MVLIVLVGKSPLYVGVNMLVDRDLLPGVNAAAGHGEYGTGGTGKKIEIVGNYQAGNVQAFQDVEKITSGFFVEPIGRFIQKKDFRFHGHQSGQGDEFFFPSRKPMGNTLIETLEAEKC